MTEEDRIRIFGPRGCFRREAHECILQECKNLLDQRRLLMKYKKKKR
jgi:hypothetical protein